MELSPKLHSSDGDDQAKTIACLAAVYAFIACEETPALTPGFFSGRCGRGSSPCRIPCKHPVLKDGGLTEADRGTSCVYCPAKITPWAAASRLESTSLTRSRVNCCLGGPRLSNLWKLTTYPRVVSFLAVILALSAFNMPALSDTMELPVSQKQNLDSPGNCSRQVKCRQSIATCRIAPTASIQDGQGLPIRVLIMNAAKRVNIGAPYGATLRHVSTGEVVAHLPSSSKGILSISPAGLLGLKEGTRTREAPLTQVSYVPQTQSIHNLSGKKPSLPLRWSTTASGYFITPESPDGCVAVNDVLYRGTLWVKLTEQADSFVIINILDLEDYLLSVLPSEMPSSWPIEALKAQAIAARSYAVAALGKHELDGFDVKASVEDQVYQGVASETQATNLAALQTRGLVLKHEGKVVPTFFHSTSGGFTELSEYVWNKSIPYLRSVPAYDEQSPYFSWSRSVNIAYLEESLNKSGLGVGQFLGLWVISRTPTMRASNVILAGTDGAKIVRSEDIRHCLKLPSTNFNVDLKGETYLFAGKGYGHGLGLSQWGAKSLAEYGYNAAQILTYYYKDVSLDYF